MFTYVQYTGHAARSVRIRILFVYEMLNKVSGDLEQHFMRDAYSAVSCMRDAHLPHCNSQGTLSSSGGAASKSPTQRPRTAVLPELYCRTVLRGLSLSLGCAENGTEECRRLDRCSVEGE
jgi:hypothetical protein